MRNAYGVFYYFFLFFPCFFYESLAGLEKSRIFAPQLRNQCNAQMAESVDALVSNTSGFTSIPVRPRVWVQRKELSICKSNIWLLSFCIYVPELFPSILFKKNILFIPIRYWVNRPSDMTQAEWSNELNAHSFEVYYDENYDPVSSDHVGNNVMVLHLRHNISDAMKDVKRESAYVEYLSSDISEALTKYRTAHGGNNPNEIRIKYDRNITDSGMDKAASYLNESGFRYAEYVQWYEEALSSEN